MIDDVVIDAGIGLSSHFIIASCGERLDHRPIAFVLDHERRSNQCSNDALLLQ
jgi:hypothetical protein